VDYDIFLILIIKLKLWGFKRFTENVFFVNLQNLKIRIKIKTSALNLAIFKKYKFYQNLP